MPNLYALIIGINKYPIPAHRLQGCVPDATAMYDFLNQVCALEGMNFNPVVLFDKKATLGAIVDGFAHFGQAKDGDICVLYYSGHGSQMHSPREFWTIDTDRLLETLVCYDSRLRGGRDLTDKELSYLIWKYTRKQNKDIHFLSIFDCCHSGTITRGVKEEKVNELTSRMANKNLTRFGLGDMVGFEEYIKREDGAIIPPLGDYVTLSAAQSDESAYEMRIAGKPRGIFTNALLDVLERTNLKYISYAELVSRVYTRVQNRTNAQTPQHPLANAYGLSTTRGLFLNGKMTKSPRSYVKHDAKQGWIIDMGMLHGVRKGTRLEIDVNGESMGMGVRSVQPGQAVVEPDSWLDANVAEYLIKNIDLKSTPMFIGINPGLEDTDAKCELEDAIGASDKLVLDYEAATYWANLDEERGYTLTRPGEEMPVFKGVRKDVASNPVPIFIDNVEKVAFWEYVSELSNPLARVRIESWLDIEFLEVIEHNDFIDVLKSEEKSLDGEAVFSYQNRHGEWIEPAFQLKVRNKSGTDLWIAGLYLSEDFSITDVFMPAQILRRGSEPCSFTDDNGNDIIELWLPDEIHSWGGTEIINRIKIIASSEPFKVENLCQDGLELEHKDTGFRGATRGARRNRNTPQWVTKDLQLRIVRPLDAEPLQTGRDLRIQNLTIKGHDGFSAEGVSLATSQEAARSTSHSQLTFNLDHFRSINLATSRDTGSALDVIELNNVTGTEQITADQPLKLQLGQSLPEDTTIVPFGLDSTTGLYFPLGYTDSEGNIRIEQIPDSEDGTKRGFLKSSKIYLKGLWFNKVLKTELDTSVLAIAEVKGEEDEVVFIKDEATVQDKVKEAKKILVLVHGWMGGSRDKVRIVRRAKHHVNGEEQDLHAIYDLVLTFDYNSMGQSIEKSAQQLKAQLEMAGLSTTDDKTVHLLAHATGGLVARWMLEKENGEGLVDHLVMAGCPNLGTPWASVYDFSVLGLSKLINFLPIPGNVSEVLGFLGYLTEDMNEMVMELQGGSPLFEELNANAVAPIPYTIITGNTQLLPQRDDREEKLVRRYLDRFKGAYRKSLETVLFGEANDDIVSIQSMKGPDFGDRAEVRTVEPVGSSHMTYFASDESVKVIGEVLFGL